MLYTIDQLMNNYMTKLDLAREMKLKNFDASLPQDWLNEVSEKSPELSYDLIRSTTFWVYGDAYTGPISGCIEVQELIESMQFTAGRLY